MPRALDLRTDEQMVEERRLRIWRNQWCRLYPGCECGCWHTRGECSDRIGVLFDDER